MFVLELSVAFKMDSVLVSSGSAAVIVLANALISKVFMTVAFRFKLIKTKGKDAKRDIIEGAEYKNAHAAQLNDAEYSPLFVATLLYLHSKGISAPLASTLAAFGCVWYLWAKIYLPFPSQALGAAFRYISLGLICLEIYKSL